MRDFIKISTVDSLQTSENQPNSLARIREDAMAVLNFLYRLWEVEPGYRYPPSAWDGFCKNFLDC